MVDIDVSRIMHCFGVRYFVVLSDNCCAYCVQEAAKLMMLAIMTKIIVVPG